MRRPPNRKALLAAMLLLVAAAAAFSRPAVGVPSIAFFERLTQSGGL